MRRIPYSPAVERLLEQAGLVTGDAGCDGDILWLGTESAGNPIGVVGLEPCGTCALLRSLVVAPDWRGRGLGRTLVKAVEALARDRGFTALYLLTEEADAWFDRLGYGVVARGQAPDTIAATAQFSSLCPASAVLMYRQLGDSAIDLAPA